MKPARRLTLGLFVAALAAGAGVVGWRLHATNRAWRDAQPTLPELRDWPAEFASELRAADKRASSHDVAALGELAELYLANGFSAEAEHALRGLERFAPDDARAAHRLGVLLAGAGRLDEAIPRLQRAAKLAPDHVPTRLRLAEALAKTNREAEAAAEFEAALQREPRNPWALAGRARLEMDEGRWSAARQRLEEAMKTAPEFSTLPSLLAVVYERTGRGEEAERMRARAAQLGRYVDPPDGAFDDLWRRGFDGYRLQVAAATLVLGSRPAEALPVLERALGLAPSDARTLRQLGRLQEKLGRVAEARKSFEGAIAAAPDDGATYLDLVRVCHSLDDGPAASRWVERGLAAAPLTAGLQFERGRELANLGRLAEAEALFAEAARLAPENTNAAFERADVLLRLGRHAEAIAVITEAMERQPIRPQADGVLTRVQRAGVSRELQEKLAATYRRLFGEASR